MSAIRPRPHPPISRERWQRLEPLVDEALALDGDERRVYCEAVAARDTALGAELARLVARAEARDPLLDAGAVERFAVLFSPSDDTRDLRAEVQDSLAGSYAIERELGGGGMSRVFVAVETGLGRQVVLKVLTPELAAGISIERFAREIKLAASLQQANIVPLHTAGTAAGLPYYTMPYVEGRSLRELLEGEGALPIGEATGILRDIARALSYAHARGVIHRDIKPGNVLLSAGTAVVTDFGIAKALGAARGATRSETLTVEGVSLGTPAYMAPEQASGDPSADHRADIYAFGCLAYEMLTGRPPFHGVPAFRVIAAHFTERPAAVTQLRPEVPTELAELVARCLEKEPAHRPQSATELLEHLDGAITLPRTARRAPARIGTRVAMALGITVVAVATIYASSRTATAEPLTFALVPFRNVTSDTALEYRSDGIGDEILNGMSRVPGVQIVGRTMAQRYKDRPGAVVADLKTIARDLGARFLVTGSVREEGTLVMISTQLNDSATRGEVWAATFVRDAKDLGSITDEIVGALADTLRAHYPRRVGRRDRAGPTAGTSNAAALDLYLVGQALLKRRGSGVPQSVEKFERAIALDSSFARAYAALATALQLYPYFVGTPPAEVRERTVHAAQRALALDSTSAEAHEALALVYAADGAWSRSNDEMAHAVSLEPNNVAVRQTYARLLIHQGKENEAIAQCQAARSVERVSPLVSAWLSYAYFITGRTDSAMAEIARAVQLDSTLLPVVNLAALLSLDTGKPDAAVRLMSVNAPPGLMVEAPYVFAKAGDVSRANRVLDAVMRSTPRPWFAQVARATEHLALGDSAGALSALEESSRASGPIWIQYLPLQDRAYDLVRESPRFQALVRQAGLDPAEIGAVSPSTRH